ncbi:MAG: 3'-5' exonuclease [Bacilli bacterium]|jgi:DNA polymerase III epsilon subunit family exonuclease|nr:3'-5' exonuclease [Bacilli bacterium]
MNQLKFVDSYIVFDTETTGLHDQVDHIIEIGALKVIQNEIVEEFDMLINPGTPIPEIITKITGITTEMISHEKKIEDVLPEFLTFIEDLPLICHNAPFDIGFMNAALQKANLPILKNQALDTIEFARIYIPKAYNYKLETLKNYFKLDFGSHRSVEDCKTTHYIYQECKKRASQVV